MIFVFLRSLWATLIPAIAVPVSIIGTFGVMYALGYSLDNLSLMGLSIAVGFVVDDAIVMVENIARHIEMGKKPLQAALDAAGEIGFTILSISISLVAVFIPLLLMGGMVGRMFQEFAVTVTVAIGGLRAGVADAHPDDGSPTAAARTPGRAGAPVARPGVVLRRPARRL